MITLDDLMAICKFSKRTRLAQFVDPLNDAMHEFEIDNNQRRAAHFLAQICHESGCFTYTREIASGEAYEGRQDLGNTEPGDGVRFKGRGLIQITGRSNYRQCGEALGVDLIADPKALEEPVLACRSAAWFWSDRGLNTLADNGDARAITKKINGGLTGFQDRLNYLALAQERLV